MDLNTPLEGDDFFSPVGDEQDLDLAADNSISSKKRKSKKKKKKTKSAALAAISEDIKDVDDKEDAAKISGDPINDDGEDDFGLGDDNAAPKVVNDSSGVAVNNMDSKVVEDDAVTNSQQHDDDAGFGGDSQTGMEPLGAVTGAEGTEEPEGAKTGAEGMEPEDNNNDGVDKAD